MHKRNINIYIHIIRRTHILPVKYRRINKKKDGRQARWQSSFKLSRPDGVTTINVTIYIVLADLIFLLPPAKKEKNWVYVEINIRYNIEVLDLIERRRDFLVGRLCVEKWTS